VSNHHRVDPQAERIEGSPAVRRLFDLAYGRAGDKGNVANVSVIARSAEAYTELKAKATAERVKRHIGALVRGRVERFELDNIESLNFVLYDALDGGATRSLRIDGLGKSLAGAVLSMPVDEE
jgi:hypothetical protein